MKCIDLGILPHSYCFSFTPSESAKQLYYYPTWCGRYFCTSHYYKKRDYFPELLVAYVRHGDFYLAYEGHHYFVGKGQAFLIDCQRPHYYHASENLEFVYIHFDGGNARSLCDRIMAQQGAIFDEGKAQKIGEHIFDLVERLQNGEQLDAPDFSLYIYQLIILMISRNTNIPPSENPVDISIKYIQEHVAKKITLDELASLVGLSKYHYAHLFKAETGYSPMEYVIGTRLNKAKTLLKTTHMSIAEIAYAVGYNNPGSFINLFTNKTGQSPKAYRTL